MYRARPTPTASLVSLALLACLSSCQNTGEATACEDSSDCAIGEICEQRLCRVNCVSPGVECPEGLRCQHGVCLPPPVAPLPDAGSEDVEARDVAGAELATIDGARADVSHPDATAPDAVELDAGTICADDEFEPNDSSAQAAPIRIPERYVGLISCGVEDEDWYGFTLPAGESLTVTIEFNSELADLDLALYDLDESSPIDWSAGVDSREQVLFGPDQVDRELQVQVESWEQTPTSYDMEIDL